MKNLHLLGLCGSLRAASSNRALLEVAATLVPEGVLFSLHEGFAEFPLFNPDQEAAAPPPVLRFREALVAADAIVIASPEYAHGITGSLKNALDWVVGSGEFSGKPVAVLNASHSSHHAHEALIEILATMDAKVIPDASVRVPLPNSRTSREEIAGNPVLVELLRQAIGELSWQPRLAAEQQKAL